MDQFFWASLGKIVWIDVLLSGDNAIVIALACAGLPRSQRLLAMCVGTGAAVLLRVALTGSASYLMTLPWLRLCGGAALLYVAIKLLIPDEDGDPAAKAPRRLLAAMATIVVADASMSIDNVLAVAAAANGNVALLAVGLCLSIPIVVAGASAISEFIGRFPILVWAGAALLGWIAGGVIAGDSFVAARLRHPFDAPHALDAAGAACVIFAAVVGRRLLKPIEAER